MSAERFEAFLATLYVDESARARFLADRCAEAVHAGLTENECVALQTIDLVGLELAAASYARKRAAHPPARTSKIRWLKQIFGRV